MSDPQPMNQYQPPGVLEEAIARHEYEERIAWGDVDGTTVWVKAAVDGAPVLQVVAGCEVPHDDGHFGATPVGGYTHGAEYQHVEMLDAVFEQFVDEYDLAEHEEVEVGDERE